MMAMAERLTQAERRARSRGRLIEAAIDVLATRGYAGTTLVEIGKAANLSRGLVNYHFSTKEACMAEVVTAIRADADAEFTRRRPHTRGMEALDLMLDSYFSQMRHRPAAARAMYVLLVEAVTASPGLLEAVASTNELIREFITEKLAEAIEDGDVSPDTDIAPQAVLVEAVLRGVGLQWLADPTRVDLNDVVQVARRMLRSHLQVATETTARTRRKPA
jgi:AcrR family transcriptional regulator